MSPLAYYLACCKECGLLDMSGYRPVRASKQARTHANRNPGHETWSFNMTQLTVAHAYRYDPLTQHGDSKTLPGW